MPQWTTICSTMTPPVLRPSNWIKENCPRQTFTGKKWRKVGEEWLISFTHLRSYQMARRVHVSACFRGQGIQIPWSKRWQTLSRLKHRIKPLLWCTSALVPAAWMTYKVTSTDRNWGFRAWLQSRKHLFLGSWATCSPHVSPKKMYGASWRGVSDSGNDEFWAAEMSYPGEFRLQIYTYCIKKTGCTT